MQYEALTYTETDGVAVIKLNRPDKLNALDTQVMRELPHAFDHIQDNTDVRCVVLTGEGDRAFSVGFDLDGSSLPDRTDELRKVVASNFRTLLKVWDLRVPCIAAVNGYAVAAGCNLSMVCDVTLAGESAKFGEPELRHYALSPLLLLPWFNGNPKMMHYLYYSGDTITAAEAYEFGMVAKVIPDDELEAEAMRMARRIAKVPAYSVEMTKDSLRRTYELMGFRNALEYHRVNDSLVLGASGIPDKDKFTQLIENRDMRAFLSERDGPFKES